MNRQTFSPRTISIVGAFSSSVGRALALCALVVASASAVQAQIWERLTNAHTAVQVTHAPRIIMKGVTKIAVLDFGGDQRCAPEFSDRLTQMLSRSSKFEVIDRANVASVLQEQGLQASGAVSPEAAVRLGQLLGPAAVITGRITRCSVVPSGLLQGESYKSRDGRVHTYYSRRVVAHMTGSISLIDLTTGKMHAGDMLDVTAPLENQVLDGNPEAPAPEDALTKMYNTATSEVSRLVFPWTSSVSVVVFDDDKCALKQSAAQIKRGDMAAAIATLDVSLKSACDGTGDKGLLSKAYHNIGIALVYSDRPADGLEALRKASDLRDSKITSEAIVAAQTVIAENERTRLKEVNAVSLGSAKQADAAFVGMTNKDVLALVKARFSDAIIASKIRSTSCRFDVSTDALIAMKQAGASDGVILAVSEAAASKCK